MDLELTPDERDVAEAFARVFTRDSSSERVRAAEDTGFDPALWKTLAGMGAIGIAVPAAAGGSGGGFVELALIAEAAGRRLACVPLIEAAVAARLLADAGAPAGLVAAAVDGERVTVLAPRPAQQGVARRVPAGSVAEGVVALDGDELVLVHGPSGPGAAGGRDLGFQAVADRPLRGPGLDRHVLAAGVEAHELWRRARDRWRLGTAAGCAGLAAEALDIAVRYATGRHQFGAPIGSFQALQQPLADVAMAADGARLVAREAAWRHDHGLQSWAGAAAVAFAHAAETAVRAAELCLHVHGGYGFTMEYDAQLYLRRAKATRLSAGDPDLLWEEIGAATMAAGAH
ncbi:acyl-CoA dehydrogenase family protein [Dactylosporangium sucinum]|uniref:Acyl-CoA dehydrogenase n=1 Tax=Dactylosporangium sucinum TaxID=1424081 RepID=A0A917UB60_9ACTN|nr:acyl-CoA dehydrogenase [Dactylosporangium sucinum]GGM75123.1 acyl-CoA dehydrogenase [Dactylosporangium sucinum]